MCFDVWKYVSKYVWVEKCVEISVMLFKNWKQVFKQVYQTAPGYSASIFDYFGNIKDVHAMHQEPCSSTSITGVSNKTFRVQIPPLMNLTCWPHSHFTYRCDKFCIHAYVCTYHMHKHIIAYVVLSWGEIEVVMPYICITLHQFVHHLIHRDAEYFICSFI